METNHVLQAGKKAARKRWRAPQPVQARARQLRREMTPAESALWERLRDRQLEGAHFRAQHAVDRFIVDFICVKARLVVEVDGDGHAERAQADYDLERTAWLAAQRRYRVLRFDNAQVMGDLDRVVAAIRAALSG
jgi:very-short-patch-repair endonuclease